MAAQRPPFPPPVASPSTASLFQSSSSLSSVYSTSSDMSTQPQNASFGMQSHFASASSAPLPSPHGPPSSQHFPSFEQSLAAQQQFQQQQLLQQQQQQQQRELQQQHLHLQRQHQQVTHAGQGQQSSFGQSQQHQQRPGAEQLQRFSSFEYKPDRTNAGSSNPETVQFLNEFGLLAEAAKRAQMAVLMRDLEGCEL